MTKETVMAYFKGLLQHLSRGIEVNHVVGFLAEY